MVIFLSDTHLGSRYSDHGHAAERRVSHFLRSLPDDVTHIYLLGDILDYWFEYRTVAPRGFIRFFGELARLADSGVKITWLTGNHDIWMNGYLADELGIEVVDAPYIIRKIGNKTFLLAHGDRIGHRSRSFRFISRVFRNRICRRLFAAIHPGLTVGFAHRWSSHSRASGYAPSDSDIRRILTDAATVASEHPEVNYIIEGHHHIPLQEQIGPARLIVLGDWASDGYYASYDGHDVALNRLNLT